MATKHEYAHLSSSGSPERELVGIFNQPKSKRVCSLQTFGGEWIALPLRLLMCANVRVSEYTLLSVQA